MTRRAELSAECQKAAQLRRECARERTRLRVSSAPRGAPRPVAARSRWAAVFCGARTPEPVRARALSGRAGHVPQAAGASTRLRLQTVRVGRPWRQAGLPITALAFGPDGALAVADAGSDLQLFNAAAAAHAPWSAPGGAGAALPARLAAMPGHIAGVSFNPHPQARATRLKSCRTPGHSAAAGWRSSSPKLAAAPSCLARAHSRHSRPASVAPRRAGCGALGRAGTGAIAHQPMRSLRRSSGARSGRARAPSRARLARPAHGEGARRRPWRPCCTRPQHSAWWTLRRRRRRRPRRAQARSAAQTAARAARATRASATGPATISACCRWSTRACTRATWRRRPRCWRAPGAPGVGRGCRGLRIACFGAAHFPCGCCGRLAGGWLAELRT